MDILDFQFNNYNYGKDYYGKRSQEKRNYHQEDLGERTKGSEVYRGCCYREYGGSRIDRPENRRLQQGSRTGHGA